MIPRCPQCRAPVLQKSTDGKLKLRTNILVFEGNKAITKCRRCKADVEVDIQLGSDLRKALLSAGPRLTVRNSLDVTRDEP